MQIGFDNDKYTAMQSERIRQRIDTFGGKLYMEFGGKLFDDYHASRVLPGFLPDSKVRMLLNLKDQAETGHCHQRRMILKRTRFGATLASPTTADVHAPDRRLPGHRPVRGPAWCMTRWTMTRR